MSTDLLTEALEYAELGLHVFPLRPGTKVPLTARGVHDATDDPAVIREWWGQTPDAGIGLACGPSGLLVVDVDTRAGFGSLEAARLALGLPETFTVATRSGGWHFYFEGEGRNSVDRVCSGVDTRGVGGYVVAPPTPGYSIVRSDDLARAPQALIEALEGSPKASAERAPLDPDSILDGVPEGRRNDTLFRYACRLRQLGVAQSEAEVLVSYAARMCQPPYDAFSAVQMVARVWDGYQAPEEAENAKYGPLRPIREFTSEPTTWLWHLRIPLGKVTVIAGVQGQGKSYLTCALAADVSTGRQLPGGVGANGQGAALPPSGVILGAYEDGIGDTVRPRLEALGADLDRIHALGFWHEGSDTAAPFRAEHVPQLAEALQSRPDVRLLIIDPITSFLGGKVDGNSNEQVRDSLESLVRLAEKYQVAVVAVAHLNKAELSAALYRVAGATAFTALPRSVLMVGRCPDTGRRGIGHVKSNLGPLADVVEFHIGDEGFRWGFRVSDLPLSQLLKNR